VHHILRRQRQQLPNATWTPVDARSRADDALRRARSRDSSVVTGAAAGSPADSSATVVIPRHVITAVDPRHADPDSTQVIPVRSYR
jgi:hypothetical protein